ncbi:MAG TPA: nitrogenase component 1 [Desulfitobacteriaceae bacterium]|nr:nitrogenase component 1 [Desulfitobacteriaceae bacterium]
MGKHCFVDTVRYCSPSHGGWGVVRMGMLVPESYQLFVCPFACGRHGAIGAIVQNFKDRLSYLYIDELDIVSGGYEQLIPEAVGELLAELSSRPRVLMVFVSCLDDLLGTDHEAFLRVLRTRYPDMRFVVGHMNPITLDGKIPPPVNIQRQIYSLLERSDRHVAAVNFIGNNVAISHDSEIYEVLRRAGFPDIRHISECGSFAEFQAMADSSLNFVPTPVGLVAAQEMQRKLNIEYFYAPVSYDFEEIEDVYQRLLARTGTSMDFTVPRERAEKALEHAGDVLAGMPVVIDASATVRPFTLARLLLIHGFNVREIYAQESIALEQESLAWLEENAAHVAIYQPEHHRSPVIRQQIRECLAIGFECAYLTGAKYVVDLANDETLYGFQGVERLMDRIAAAAGTQADLQAMVAQYGLVV